MNFSEIQQHPKFLVSPDFTPPIKGEHILNRTPESLFKDLLFGLFRLTIPLFLYKIFFDLMMIHFDDKYSFSTNFPKSSLCIRLVVLGIPVLITSLFVLGLVFRCFSGSRKIYFEWGESSFSEIYSDRCFLQTDDLGYGFTSRSPFEEFHQVEDITLIKEWGEMEILLKGYGGWLSKMRKREVTRRVRVTPERRFNDKTNELYKYLKQIVDIRDELQNKKGL
jgi:hypothetical protein